MEQNKKNTIFLILRVIFSFSILAFLFLKIGIGKIVSTLANFNPLILIIILILYCLFFIMGTVNLKLLSNLPNRKVSFKILFKYMILSWSYGLFLPSKIGEFSLVYFMKKEGYKVGETTALSLVDKVITLVVLLMLSSYGLFVFLGISASLIIILSFSVILIFSVSFILSNFGRKIIKKVLKGYSNIFKGFSKSAFFYIKKAKLMLFLNFVITFLKWIIVAVIFQIMFRSYEFDISFFLVLSISAASTIVSLIPITIAGIGVRESFAVFAYSHIGVTPSIVFAVFLIVNIINYIIASISIITITDNKKKRIEQSNFN